MIHMVRAIARRIGVYEVTAFITGFALMAYELAASRVLAPSIGTSTYVWTSIIGIMIAALAIGYATGGWVADRRAQQKDIVWLLLAAAFAVVCSCLLYPPVLENIVETIGDPRMQGVVAALLLFAPASFLMGMISPYLARLRIHSLHTTGRSVAGLSACNSIGGIAGTFCTGFIFFSLIGSRETMALIAMILIACSWLLLPRLQIRQRLMTTAALTFVIAFQFVSPVEAGVVADIDTPTSHYKIMDISYYDQPVRVLIMGPGGWQSGMYLDGSKQLVFKYTRSVAQVVDAAPQKDRILILGGGAFTLPEYFGRMYPASHIDVVELDAKLPEIARHYFDYDEPSNVRTITQDARTYLQQVTDPYDIVIADVYNDASIPFALATREYTASLQKAMAPGGVAIANIIAAANTDCLPLLTSVHGSYTNAFDHNRLFPLEDPHMKTLQNITAVYSDNPLTWTNALSQRAYDNNLDMSAARVLTDNYAPTEALKERCE
jgi:spermidine synthase